MNIKKFGLVIICCIIIGFLMDYVRETYSVSVAFSLVVIFILLLFLYSIFKKRKKKQA